ncbi:MAG: oxidoreductase [Firmicutes bacterium]|nr:oxidoreductase [Bacillota bacterium]
MIYRKFQDLKLSMLGMGTMRLPVKNQNDADIDVEAAKEMVAYAMKQGVNYYDTAWGYHDGNSETVMGEILAEYPRESFYLASKFPGYDLANMPKVKEIFERQLEKCKVDYFDFYLVHNVCEMNIDAYLDESYGIYEYLMEQKRNGRIRHLGFSAHGSYEMMERFLEKYGQGMEFCQLQLNYVDWTLQADKEKMELAEKYHLPIWVMEPMRGGKLASLPEADAAKLAELRPEESVAAWAFRFLQSLPKVTVVLTGASTLEQITENIEIFGESRPLSEAEMEILLSIADGMLDGVLPCTACHYCTSHCPKGLDIPMLLDLYNEHNFTGGGFIAPMALMAVAEDKQPASCIGCKSCEAVCPQQIKIADALKHFAQIL